MDWETIRVALVDGAIYTLNGFLITAYWLYEQAPLLATAPAVLWALRFDRAARHEAGFRSRRYGRGELNRGAHGAAGWTLAAAILWALASVLSAPPIPVLGAAMWWAMLLAAHWLPRERDALLFRHKGLLVGYSLLAIALWVLLAYSPAQSGIDLSRLSRLLGSWRDAVELVGSVQGSLVPYAALVVWVLYPLGYFVLLAQRAMVHRGPQVGPGATAEQLIREIRQRES